MRRLRCVAAAARRACGASQRSADAAPDGARRASTCLLATARALAPACPAHAAARAAREDAWRLRAQLRRWSSSSAASQASHSSASAPPHVTLRRVLVLRALTHRSCAAQPRCRPRCTRVWWSCAPAMTSWRTRLAQTCVRARAHGRRRPHPSAHAFGLRLRVHMQPPLSLERIIAINKELTQLSPVVEAFEALRELEEVRTVARAQPSPKAHTRQCVSPADGGRARCSARAGDRHAGRGGGHRGRRRRDARARRGGTQRRFAMHTLACTHAAVAAAVC
jgi:hypothetical protein